VALTFAVIVSRSVPFQGEKRTHFDSRWWH